MAIGLGRSPLTRWVIVAAVIVFLLWLRSVANHTAVNGSFPWQPLETPGAHALKAGNTLDQHGPGAQAHFYDGELSQAQQLSKLISEHEGIKPGSLEGVPQLLSGQYTTADDFQAHFNSILDSSSMSISSTKTGCIWPPSAEVDFQFGYDSDWVLNQRSDEEVAEKQREWKEFIRSGLIPYKDVADKFSGRGIVVCAGNERSLRRLHVLLNMLRATGTDLPVEVHYFGDEELKPEERTTLLSMYVTLYFNDLSDDNAIMSTKHTNFMVNYNVKLAALLNSRFAEPLLLDSDNTPVSDPISLFESSTYRTFATVFYPDIARTRPENPMWAITNTPCRKDEYELESGQLIVDKRRFWYHLQLAAYFGHQDYYQGFLLGDKDCFRFAWHALKTPYGRPARWVTSIGFVARPEGMETFPALDYSHGGLMSDEEKFQGGTQSIYCGHSFGQHHPDAFDSPLLFLHGGLLKTLSQDQIVHVRNNSHGLFSAYKQSPMATTVNDLVEKVAIKFDKGASYLGEKVNEDHITQCTDMKNVLPLLVGDDATKELIGFEEKFENAGGFWMLDLELWNSGHGFFG